MPTRPLLVCFYLGDAPDHRRRFVHEIWRWDHSRLESTHDYIQWLFPLDTVSAFNDQAPIVDAATMREFREDSTLRDRLRQSLELMLSFYGLRQDAAAGAPISRHSTFDARARVWLHRGNHNHLRLTRIIRSLTLLGRADDATALSRCLMEIASDYPDRVSPETLRYWREAPLVRA